MGDLWNRKTGKKDKIISSATNNKPRDVREIQTFSYYLRAGWSQFWCRCHPSQRKGRGFCLLHRPLSRCHYRIRCQILARQKSATNNLASFIHRHILSVKKLFGYLNTISNLLLWKFHKWLEHLNTSLYFTGRMENITWICFHSHLSYRVRFYARSWIEPSSWS